MKTLSQVKKEIDSINKQLAFENRGKCKLTEKKEKRLVKDLKLLNKVRNYYESVNVTKELIEREYNSVRDKIDSLSKGFSKWCANNPHLSDNTPTQKQSKFETETGLKKLKEESKTLKFILS